MIWTAHVNGGLARVNHAAVCIDNNIYSFGGYWTNGLYKSNAPISVHILDTTTLRWAEINFKKNDAIPFQRYGHTTVAYGEKVYMWGGRNHARACHILCCFDTKTLEWSNPAVRGMVPPTKDGHSACIIRNKMYTFGGLEFQTNQYSQQVHCLNLDNMEWSFIETEGSPPSPRDFHTAIVHGTRMYVYGGRGKLPYNSTEEVYSPLVYYLETITKHWVTLTPNGKLPKGRRSHSAWLHNHFMYIFGGFDGSTHFNDLFRYSIQHNVWESLKITGNVPSRRRRQVSILCNDVVYLFGGTSPSTQNDQNTENVQPFPLELIDNSDLHLLEYAPSLKTLCILVVLENNLNQNCLPPAITMDISSMSMPNRISR